MNILDRIDKIVNENTACKRPNNRRFKSGRLISEAAGFDAIEKMDNKVAYDWKVGNEVFSVLIDEDEDTISVGTIGVDSDKPIKYKADDIIKALKAGKGGLDIDDDNYFFLDGASSSDIKQSAQRIGDAIAHYIKNHNAWGHWDLYLGNING